MTYKINIKARIDRHSRIIKENFSIKDKVFFGIKRKRLGYKLVISVMVFLMPIYPIFASFVHNNTEYDFYRGYIDESSIIESYYTEESEENLDENLYEFKESFLSVSTVLNDNRDLTGTNEIVNYKVQPGESVSYIAYKFQVSNNSIYWANNFDKNYVIHPGDVIKIPPVSGVIHQVEKGDTISSIAKKYSVDSSKITEQNLFVAGEQLNIGEVLVIPGAIKEKPKPKYVAPKVVVKKYASKTNKSDYNFVNDAASEFVNVTGTYKLTAKPKYHNFYWGNCTWYVAKYKTVTWGGNAKDWFKNAKAAGETTGYNPKLGSIIVFNGRGYNPIYGHVGIVMEVKSDHIIVSDMNYRRLNEVTYRKVPLNDRAILGYIYVD